MYKNFPRTVYYIYSTRTQGHNIAQQEASLGRDREGMEEFVRACCVPSYYVYRDVWEATVGEELACEREPHNAHNCYTVAVKRRRVIVGGLPRKLLKLCLLFLRQGGTILCRVTGARRYSKDLPQGGLEVPCTLLFKHQPKEVQI